MLRYGQQYVDAGAEYFEHQYHQRALHTARRRAAQLGYQLVPIADVKTLDIQHMQKALTQMNVKLQHVIRDITGKTGMDIIEAIVGGERDPRTLAPHRSDLVTA